MSEPFLAEIRMVGFNFAPRGWAFCDGQILPINQNQSLYSLLGTTYGGDGRTTFQLPDLRGRTPVHVGDGVTLGQKSGQENVTLGTAQMPQHQHAQVDRGVSYQARQNVPADVGGANWVAKKARRNGAAIYAAGNHVAMASDLPAGSSQGHTNMQPFLAVRFCIALQGLFPSRN
jgi:microcystin-dependent protein